MQRIAAIAITDASGLEAFLEAQLGAWSVARGMRRGVFGVGFERYGEALVRKSPIGPRLDSLAPLRGVRTKHLLVTADASAGGLEVAQPHRYRAWLFAASGLEGLGRSFIARVEGMTSAMATRPRSVSQAALLVFMDGLYRANLLDAKEPGSPAVVTALGAALVRLVELTETPALAALLHLRGHTFGLAAERALGLVRHGESDRRRHAQQRGSQAVVLRDFDTERLKGDAYRWACVHIASDVAVHTHAVEH